LDSAKSKVTTATSVSVAPQMLCLIRIGLIPVIIRCRVHLYNYTCIGASSVGHFIYNRLCFLYISFSFSNIYAFPFLLSISCEAWQWHNMLPPKFSTE
jgi:hypothetical protein